MSLTVPADLLAEAETGEIDQHAFVDTVRTSLPYAYHLIADLAAGLRSGDREYVDNLTPPSTEADRGQLLRALASDAIRGSLERHFEIRLAFQNCHRVAAFHPGAEATETYQEFTSPRAQVLNQSPELRDC